MLKESNTTYQDGTPVQQSYSEMEKQLCRDYPNFGPTMWTIDHTSVTGISFSFKIPDFIECMLQRTKIKGIKFNGL